MSRRSLLTAVGAAGAASAAAAALAPAARADHRRHPSRLPETIALPAGIRPEGITSDRGRRLYVGSLADGRIVAADLRSGRVSTLLPGATGRQVRGLRYDPRTGLVWAAGNVGTAGYVWAVSTRTGRVVGQTLVPGAVFLNDLDLARDAVWVTDSQVDRLTVVPAPYGRPVGAPPRFVPLGGAWPAGDGVAVNANGIRVLPDRTLVLNNSRVGGLWNVDPRTGDTVRIPVSGGPGLTAGDGLELIGRTLYDVRGSGQQEVSVLRLRYGRSGWSATWVRALTDPTLDVPSTAAVAAGSLWAVNARFGVPSPETASYALTRLPLR